MAERVGLEKDVEKGRGRIIFFSPFVSSCLTFSCNYNKRRKQNVGGSQLIVKSPVFVVLFLNEKTQY